MSGEKTQLCSYKRFEDEHGGLLALNRGQSIEAYTADGEIASAAATPLRAVVEQYPMPWDTSENGRSP
jgi:hypothetical protein